YRSPSPYSDQRTFTRASSSGDGSRIRVPGHDAREGVDVAPTFEVMPPGDRELRLIDGRTADNNVLYRPGRDDDGGDRLAVFLHHVLDDFTIDGLAGKAEGEGQARSGTEAAHEKLRTATAPVAFDALEQEGRPLLLEDAPSNGSNLAVPVHFGGDPTQLTRLLEKSHPLPQVHEAHRRLTPNFRRRSR